MKLIFDFLISVWFKFWFGGLINLRRGELCSPAKSNSYLYFGRTQFAPTGFKLKFEKTDKPQFAGLFNLSLLEPRDAAIPLV